MSKVRLAIVGVGNCASSLVQGLEYYKDADPDERVPGLMHVELGGYHIRDIEVVAAFDVDAKKVGRDVAEAIFSEPNNTIRFADVPPTGVTVQRGHTLDGLGTYYREIITESDAPEVDVAQALREARADVLVVLPAGRLRAGREVLRAGRDRREGRVRELPAGVHRLGPGVGAQVRRRRRADRRRRHQEPGRAPRSCTASSRSCSRTAA